MPLFETIFLALLVAGFVAFVVLLGYLMVIQPYQRGPAPTVGELRARDEAARQYWEGYFQFCEDQRQRREAEAKQQY